MRRLAPRIPRHAPSQANSTYAEASIRVLKGLEPVKQRPGMYTRTDNPLHIIQEVIDNAADEALAGFGKRIARHAARRRLGQRRGRRPRHPVRPAPRREGAGGRDRLHAAARRRQVRQGRRRRLQLLRRPARRGRQRDQRAGQAAGGDGVARRPGGDDRRSPAATWSSRWRCARPAAGDRKQGTTVRVWPDPKYFESAELPRAELMHLLRSKAVLMPGVTVTLTHREDAARTADLALQGRPARLPAAEPAGRPADPAVRGRAVRRRRRDRELRRRRGRGLVRGLHRRRQHAARELRQPDPDGGRRHPRSRA